MYAPSTVGLSRRSVPPPLPVYHPLNTDRSEIRLCSIQPGKWDDQISCKLLIYSLDQSLGYRCLSYVWGDSTDRVPISLNGQAHSITRNLWLALRRLRWYEQLDYFWIDAICINQADIVEKTQQVRRMTEIFSRSHEVIVWLGEADCLGRVIGYEDLSPAMSLTSIFRGRRRSKDKSSNADQNLTDEEPSGAGFLVAFINNLASGKHITNMEYMKSCRSCEGRGEHVHTTTTWAIVIRCLQRFSNLAWFSRTWTIQEIVLPKTAGVVIGPYNFTWAKLLSALHNLMTHWHGARTGGDGAKTGCCNLIFRKLPVEHYFTLQTFCNQIHVMESIRCQYLGDGDIKLPSLLGRFRYRQATDPRDKVFGLLGLQRVPGSVHIGIRADYSQGTASVFTSLTIEAFRVQRSLQILHRDLKHSMTTHLPSWVPDWTSLPTETHEDPGPGDVWEAGLHHFYGAARGFDEAFEFDYDENRGEVILGGLLFDSVATVANTICHSREMNQIARDMLEFMDFLNSTYSGHDRYITGCTLDEAFYRLIVGDLHSDTIAFTSDPSSAQRRATAVDVQTIKDLWQPVFSNVKFNTHIHCDDAVGYSLAALVLGSRRLFITEKGYIGLGPEGTSTGDRIYVLNGAPCPFVLRRKPPSPGDHGGKHLMVGACYVHGIMDGEATESGEPKIKVTLA